MRLNDFVFNCLIVFILSFVCLIGYHMIFVESRIERETREDPFNHIVVIEKIDDYHKIVEFRGKKYFYSLSSQGFWVVGGECRE